MKKTRLYFFALLCCFLWLGMQSASAQYDLQSQPANTASTTTFIGKTNAIQSLTTEVDALDQAIQSLVPKSAAYILTSIRLQTYNEILSGLNENNSVQASYLSGIRVLYQDYDQETLDDLRNIQLDLIAMLIVQ